EGPRPSAYVVRAGAPALDGILDRRHAGVDGPGEEARGGGGDGGEGHQLRLRRGELLRGLGESLQEGLVGEGRLGTEESVPHGERVLARTRSLRRRRSGAGEGLGAEPVAAGAVPDVLEHPARLLDRAA